MQSYQYPYTYLYIQVCLPIYIFSLGSSINTCTQTCTFRHVVLQMLNAVTDLPHAVAMIRLVNYGRGVGVGCPVDLSIWFVSKSGMGHFADGPAIIFI